MDEIQLGQLLDPNLPEERASEMVAEYCRIDLSNLDLALSRHSSLYAYTVAAYELARVQEARAKWSLEVTKSDVYQVLVEKDPKVSVSAADKSIARAVTTKTAMEEMFKAQVAVARLKALVSGLEHRRDMLVQISARQRQEMAS